MAHLIETDIDTVYTPQGEFAKTWHGLETQLPGAIELDGANIPDIFCPVIQCGLRPDFDAEIATASEDLKAEGACNLEEYKLILADCRAGKSGKVIPLHVPKAGYKIHQNRDLFDAMVSAAQAVLGNGFEIVTAGTLGGYSQFFLSLAIKGQESFDVGTLANAMPDKWKQFFNLNSSHNGMIASNRMLASVRMVCMNTVQMAISDATGAGTIASIKHTANSDENISAKIFARDLEVWIKQGQAFKTLLAACKAAPMDLEGFRAFAAGVFTNEKSDNLSTNSFNRIGEMESLFAKGAGNVGASRYDAINAFTEFFTSGNGAGSDKVKLNKRIATANFGRANEWKLQAIATATDEAAFEVAAKRGKTLFADKQAVVLAGN